MAEQVEDERKRRQDGDAERTPGADPVPPLSPAQPPPPPTAHPIAMERHAVAPCRNEPPARARVRPLRGRRVESSPRPGGSPRGGVSRGPFRLAPGSRRERPLA